MRCAGSAKDRSNQWNMCYIDQAGYTAPTRQTRAINNTPYRSWLLLYICPELPTWYIIHRALNYLPENWVLCALTGSVVCPTRVQVEAIGHLRDDAPLYAIRLRRPHSSLLRSFSWGPQRLKAWTHCYTSTWHDKACPPPGIELHT